MSLPPLPAGWDHQKAVRASPAELRSLSEDDYQAVDTYLTEKGRQTTELMESRAAEHAKQIPLAEQKDASIATRYGLDLSLIDSTQRSLMDIARMMHQADCELWGYVIMKTWGYAEPEKAQWEAFWQRWQALAADRLREMGLVEDSQQEFGARLKWHVIEDRNRLDGAGREQVRQLFDELDDQGQLPHGVEVNVCLIANQTTVEEISAPDGLHCVTVLDRDGANEDHGYPGVFRVTFQSLMPELYEALDRQPAIELWPGNDVVWDGASTGL